MDEFVLKDSLTCIVEVYENQQDWRQVVRYFHGIQSDGCLVVNKWEDVVRTKNIFYAFVRGEMDKEIKYVIGKCEFYLNLEKSKPLLSLTCRTDDLFKTYEFNKIEAQAIGDILHQLLNRCDIVYPRWLTGY